MAMSSKAQTVHLSAPLYSVGRRSLSASQMTETIAGITLGNDHNKQRRPAFLPMSIFLWGEDLSQKIFWHFPQSEWPGPGHMTLIWLKESWESEDLIFGASRVRDRLWQKMCVYVKERGSTRDLEGDELERTIGWWQVSYQQCPP